MKNNPLEPDEPNHPAAPLRIWQKGTRVATKTGRVGTIQKVGAAGSVIVLFDGAFIGSPCRTRDLEIKK